jgi:hypothetical protein
MSMLEFSLGLARGEVPLSSRSETLLVGDPTTGAIVAVVPPDAPPPVSLWRRMLTRWAAAAPARHALYIPH